MNDRFVECLVEAFQVGNFQRAHGLDRHTERFISATVLSQGLSCGPQDPENLSPIEPLPFTMLAEAHSVHCLPDPSNPKCADCVSAYRADAGLAPPESPLSSRPGHRNPASDLTRWT